MPGPKSPDQMQQDKTAHLGKMGGFKQIRPLHRGIIPSINAAMQGEVDDNPLATPKELRKVRRSAFRAAAPIALEKVELEKMKDEAEERRAQEEKLRLQAEKISERDTLTGLGNRRYLETAVELIRGQARRNKRPFSFVILDINNLKPINDNQGHQAGDKKLQDIADTLLKTLRDSDVVTRWGGDEFALLLPNTDEAGAIEACLKLQIQLDTQTLMTGSFGITTSDGTQTPEDLFREADRAMYESKRKKSIPGDPCITTYNRMTDQSMPFTPSQSS